VTIFLLRSFTGRGIGVVALELACREAEAAWPDVPKAVASIRRDNLASQKAFAKAGFRPSCDSYIDPEFVNLQRPNMVRRIA
jgi:RimJ/RimL family protein N-acetyltransferase